MAQMKKFLDENHQWPSTYCFKFIVPQDQLPKLTALFENDKLSFRESAKGKYVSVTIEKEMPSSDAVVDVYKRATAIKGVMAL